MHAVNRVHSHFSKLIKLGLADGCGVKVFQQALKDEQKVLTAQGSRREGPVDLMIRSSVLFSLKKWRRLLDGAACMDKKQRLFRRSTRRSAIRHLEKSSYT